MPVMPRQPAEHTIAVASANALAAAVPANRPQELVDLIDMLNSDTQCWSNILPQAALLVQAHPVLFPTIWDALTAAAVSLGDPRPCLPALYGISNNAALMQSAWDALPSDVPSLVRTILAYNPLLIGYVAGHTSDQGLVASLADPAQVARQQRLTQNIFNLLLAATTSLTQDGPPPPARNVQSGGTQPTGSSQPTGTQPTGGLPQPTGPQPTAPRG